MLKFDYRVIETSGNTPGVIEAQLKMAGAGGWRLAFLLPSGVLVLEQISDPDEGRHADPPAVERITPQGEAIDEYTCGCGCGSVVGVPAKMRDEIVRDRLAPFAAGHGPRPQERTTYLVPKK